PAGSQDWMERGLSPSMVSMIEWKCFTLGLSRSVMELIKAVPYPSDLGHGRDHGW
ncbi:hypothetical protein B9479_008321, partial [Cryptococcus floricola]